MGIEMKLTIKYDGTTAQAVVNEIVHSAERVVREELQPETQDKNLVAYAKRRIEEISKARTTGVYEINTLRELVTELAEIADKSSGDAEWLRRQRDSLAKERDNLVDKLSAAQTGWQGAEKAYSQSEDKRVKIQDDFVEMCRRYETAEAERAELQNKLAAIHAATIMPVEFTVNHGKGVPAETADIPDWKCRLARLSKLCATI